MKVNQTLSATLDKMLARVRSDAPPYIRSGLDVVIRDDVPGWNGSVIVLKVAGGEQFLICDTPPVEIEKTFLSLVQDVVCDRLGHPWPQLSRAGEFYCVLDPLIQRDQAVWSRDQFVTFPAGQLRTAVSIAKLTLDE